MARTAAATVLQLSHHGGVGDVFRSVDGHGRISSVARKTVSHPLGAVAIAFELPAALHRKHRRLDDSRNRSAAVGCLRLDSYVRRLFQICFGWKRIVYPSGLYGDVHRSFDSVHRSRLP